MKQVFATVFFIIITKMTMAQNNPLDQYKWKNRVVVIYAEDLSNDRLAQQKENYKRMKSGYEERDLVVLELTDDELNNLTSKSALHDKTESLHKFLSIQQNEEFKVFLIGKDGTVKLQQSKILSNDKLFDTIDAMPMRQQEMKNDE